MLRNLLASFKMESLTELGTEVYLTNAARLRGLAAYKITQTASLSKFLGLRGCRASQHKVFDRLHLCCSRVAQLNPLDNASHSHKSFCSIFFVQRGCVATPPNLSTWSFFYVYIERVSHYADVHSCNSTPNVRYRN